MEDKIKLNFLAGVQVEESIYFSAWNINGLFKYNPKSEECNFLRSFPGEEKWGIHSEAIFYRNAIWFIPRASERIAIVDLPSLDITYIELPECGYMSEGHIPPIRMRGYHNDKEKILWVLPYTYKLLLKIDMNERKVINVERWDEGEDTLSVGTRLGDKIWIYKNSNNEMCVVNIQSGKQIKRKVENKNISYIGIQSVGKWTLLFPKWLKDGIVLFDNSVQEIERVSLEDNEQWFYEYQAITKEGDILLIPYVGNRYIKIYIKDGHCIIKDSEELKVNGNAYCSTKMFYNSEIWFLSHVTENPIICYENQEKSIQYRNITIDRKKYNQEISECINKHGVDGVPYLNTEIINEGTLMLETLLQYVKSIEQDSRMTDDKKIGEKICRLIVS